MRDIRDTPTGWGAVTLRQFGELHLIEKSVEDVIDRNLQRLAALTGKTVSYFESLEYGKLLKELRKIRFLDQLDQIDTTKIQPTVNVDGQVYTVTFQADKINAGQYITIKHLLKDMPKKKEERSQYIFDIMHELMAVLLVPAKRRRLLWFIPLWWVRQPYDGSKHPEVARHLRNHMTIEQAYPIAVFFCSLSDSWMRIIRDYSEDQRTELMKTVKLMRMELMSSQKQPTGSTRSSGGTTSSTK